MIPVPHATPTRPKRKPCIRIVIPTPAIMNPAAADATAESIIDFSILAWGTGIIAVSILSLYYPGKHFMLGSLIILLSIASWYGTSGGLIIGFIIGVIGGFMTLSWHMPRNSRGKVLGDDKRESTSVLK